MATQSTLTSDASAASRPKSRLIPVYMPYLFLLPAILLLVAFRYYPAFSAVFHSFTDWNGTSTANFVGLDQYKALANDPIFIKSVINIVIYTALRTFFSTVMALLGAELVYNLRSYVSQGIWRIVFTLPLVIPTTVVFLVWRQVYAARLGLLNNILAAIGLGGQAKPWLGLPDTALGALILIGFPLVSGFGFLVLLSALQNLPTEVNDAALIDGCTRLRRIFSIDIPSIRGPLALILILGINAGLQEFAPMLVVTNGGPVNATQSPGLYLYQQAFTYGKFGYSTAIGTVLMLMTLAFSIFILRSRYRSAHDVEV
ncbi:MAG: ABC transporter permease subunit [Anaerolineaceae bacterium]|nr:ABC transporter permease subunit [Anaerolineaceae bacterium]